MEAIVIGGLVIAAIYFVVRQQVNYFINRYDLRDTSDATMFNEEDL